MFYCDSCAKKNNFPETIGRSKGVCEMCGYMAICNNYPSSKLNTCKGINNGCSCLTCLKIADEKIGKMMANRLSKSKNKSKENDKMEKVDRQFLENIVGTNPGVEDLENLRELVEEWIVELKEVDNE